MDKTDDQEYITNINEDDFYYSNQKRLDIAKILEEEGLKKRRTPQNWAVEDMW